MSRHARLFVGGLPILLVLIWAAYFWGGTEGLPYDGFTYLAAGERLNAGHPLYGPLGPDDRPVFGSEEFAAPFLSPPLMAVAWRPLAALGEWTVYVWWAATVVALLAAIVVLWVGSPLLTGALVLATATGLAIELGVANVNSLVLAGTVLVFVLWRQGRLTAAMSIAVLLAGVKVVPIFLVLWLAAVVGRQVGRTLVVSVVVLGAISIAGAGLQAHVDYIRVLVASAGEQPGNLSMWLGLPGASLVAAAACAAVVFAARRREWLAFLAAVTGMVLAWTALAPAVASAAPNAIRSQPMAKAPASGED